jgi:enoyl-CoA hydratase/carnithine racemase
VFYGATSGYTLAFLGKAGTISARGMLGRADLRPHEGALVYHGASVSGSARASGDSGVDGPDAVGDDAIEAALRAGARVVAVTRSDAEATQVQARFPLRGAVSLETLARSPGFRWPDTMPDYDVDADGYREYQDFTLKPFGQAVGRLLATADNPRGYPDLVVERAGQDTLGVSTFIARPHGGRVVYLEDGERRRFSFYAPNVWMHQKRILFPSFAILGSHLSNAHQAAEVVQLIDGGALGVHAPAVHPWEELAEANQAIHENRHTGTLTIRVGATAALDGARSAREVYEAWGSRFVDTATVRVRLDPVRPRFPELVALVTVDSPPANALGQGTLDDVERVLDLLEAEPSLRAVVLTGAGSLFVAGADIRQLRAFATPEDVEAFAARAQRLFARIAASRAPFVSAVDGYALGGGNELQMACAYRVASARGEIGQPEINLHVIPGFGGTQMLPRLVIRYARTRGTQMYTLLVQALTMLLDGRAVRRPRPTRSASSTRWRRRTRSRTRSGSRAGSRVASSPGRCGRRSSSATPSPFPTSSETRRSSGSWPITSGFPGRGRRGPSSTSCVWASPRASRLGSRRKPECSARSWLRRTDGRGSIASWLVARCRCHFAPASEHARSWNGGRTDAAAAQPAEVTAGSEVPGRAQGHVCGDGALAPDDLVDAARRDRDVLGRFG